MCSRLWILGVGSLQLQKMVHATAPGPLALIHAISAGMQVRLQQPSKYAWHILGRLPCHAMQIEVSCWLRFSSKNTQSVWWPYTHLFPHNSTIQPSRLQDLVRKRHLFGESLTPTCLRSVSRGTFAAQKPGQILEGQRTGLFHQPAPLLHLTSGKNDMRMWKAYRPNHS